MATRIPLFLPGLFAAAADLSSDQHKFVRASAVQAEHTRVALVSAATQAPAGILQNKPDAIGKSAKVMVSGISPAVSASAITVGDAVGPDAAGLADTKTLGVDTTNFVVGQALDTTTATPQKVSLLFDCSVPNRAA